MHVWRTTHTITNIIIIIIIITIKWRSNSDVNEYMVNSENYSFFSSLINPPLMVPISKCIKIQSKDYTGEQNAQTKWNK